MVPGAINTNGAYQHPVAQTDCRKYSGDHRVFGSWCLSRVCLSDTSDSWFCPLHNDWIAGLLFLFFFFLKKKILLVLSNINQIVFCCIVSREQLWFRYSRRQPALTGVVYLPKSHGLVDSFNGSVSLWLTCYDLRLRDEDVYPSSGDQTR